MGFKELTVKGLSAIQIPQIYRFIKLTWMMVLSTDYFISSLYACISVKKDEHKKEIKYVSQSLPPVCSFHQPTLK